CPGADRADADRHLLPDLPARGLRPARLSAGRSRHRRRHRCARGGSLPVHLSALRYYVAPMAELDRLIDAFSEWRGSPLALATVIRTWGSAPRPSGSHMLVHADGRFEGSVSGGCVEGEVLHAAAETIADGEFRRLKYGVTNDSAWEVGLPCGGEI